MKKKIIIIVSVIVSICLIIGGAYGIDAYRMENNKLVIFSTWGNTYVPPVGDDENVLGDIDIVTSLEDAIGENAAWCGTFNLIWNDLKNELAKQDIVFAEQMDIVDNLNKGTFNISQISEESYYKVYGAATLELKAQIEKAIKEKFNETSSILDSFDWEDASPEDYFLYAMLKKEFEFPKVFTKLDEGTFGDFENVKFFGIDSSTKEQVRDQVEVLYYNSENDFAIKLHTKSNDEVIISVGNKENTFLDIYNSILDETSNYEGSADLAGGDTLKIPNITFDLREELTELQNKEFLFSNGEPYSIGKALQTIEFELDEKGGRIKSEAGMMVEKNSIAIFDETRHFIVDETFTIFLIEEGKDLPYFASKISDISKVQENVISNNKNVVVDDEGSNEEKIEETQSFFGTVVESNLSYIIVEPREGESIRNSADKISIGLGENNDALFLEGTNVKVTYKGAVRETYPAQVDVIDIEIKSADDFELRFYDKRPEGLPQINEIAKINRGVTEKEGTYSVYAVINIK